MYKLTLMDFKTSEIIDTASVDSDTAHDFLEDMVSTGIRSAKVQIQEMLDMADRGHKSTYNMIGTSGQKFSVEKA